MADPTQYLQLQLDGATYLLPSTLRYTVEQRHGLAQERGGGAAVAWRNVRGERWPAYCLDGRLKPAARDDWQRAVFLEAAPGGVGLAVDDVHLLGRAEVQIAPFTPPGPVPTRHGHLINAAWVNGRRVTLVLDPEVLVRYLRDLAG